jgi:hypothetical protein
MIAAAIKSTELSIRLANVLVRMGISNFPEWRKRFAEHSCSPDFRLPNAV